MERAEVTLFAARLSPERVARIIQLKVTLPKEFPIIKETIAKKEASPMEKAMYLNLAFWETGKTELTLLLKKLWKNLKITMVPI